MPAWFTRELSLGDEGPDVLIVQRKVDAPMTGVFDDDTAARIRGVEKRMGRKEQTGVVDAGVAEVLGEKPGAGQRPEWWCGEAVTRGCACECVANLRILLGQPNLPVDFDQDFEDAVRRYQSENGLPVTGVADEATVVHLADRSL